MSIKGLNITYGKYITSFLPTSFHTSNADWLQIQKARITRSSPAEAIIGESK